MPLPESDRPFAALWPWVQAGVEAGLDQASIWAEIKGSDAYSNLTSRAGVLPAVQRMRSIAGGLKRGWDRFQRAADEDLFTQAMAAPDINVRGEPARLATPEFIARFEVQFEDDEGNVQYKTMGLRDIWQQGTTVGDIRALVAERAEGMLQENGTLRGNFLGVVNIRPSMV